jgi:ferredoxin-NADP reductase
MRRDHSFHPLVVRAVVEETDDARTFVFDVPSDLRDRFDYRAGQFCTVRATIADESVLRCYSMSSAPGVDPELAVTVKRVPGGLMSNHLLDHVQAGATLELMPPAGEFCVSATDGPLIGFCGGSGVTPVFSIVKQTLATTRRPLKLLVANREPESVIFRAELDRLRAEYPARFELVHHLDSERGFLQPDAVAAFVAGCTDPEVFVCGPTAFMDLVEAALLGAGIAPDRISIERFVAGGPAAGEAAEFDPAGAADGTEQTETLTIVLKGKQHRLAHVSGDTVLDAARRAGLKPPFSCELGNCASCMALVSEGATVMRRNNALTAEEIEEGWTLTCQAQPVGRVVKVTYES